MSKDVGSTMKADVDKVTGSLFSLLERIITTSSLEKQFPFRGDLAGLAVDMANLSLDVDPLEAGDGDFQNNPPIIMEKDSKKKASNEKRRRVKMMPKAKET